MRFFRAMLIAVAATAGVQAAMSQAVMAQTPAGTAYVVTYIERDVRQMVNVHDLSAFQRFVRMCAARTGQLLNLSSLATDCGITHNTAKAWLSVLEASYIVFLLKPYFQNINKRLIKTPKLYFYDTGLAAWLIGIHDPKFLAIHPMRGPLFETFIIGELLKNCFNRGLPPNLYFFRDNVGNEVDLVMEEGGQLTPVEIKSGGTITKDYFTGLNYWTKLPLKMSGRKWLIYGGEQRQSRQGVEILPWKLLAKNIPH